MPWLRRVVVDATKTWIKEEMLWPQRMLIPAEKNVAKGEKPGFVLTETQLKKVLAEDPLLLAEQRLKSLQQIATGRLDRSASPARAWRPATRMTRRARTSTWNSRTRPTHGSYHQSRRLRRRLGRGSAVSVFLIIVWAIRLMPCFVYRHREGHRR